MVPLRLHTFLCDVNLRWKCFSRFWEACLVHFKNSFGDAIRVFHNVFVPKTKRVPSHAFHLQIPEKVVLVTISAGVQVPSGAIHLNVQTTLRKGAAHSFRERGVHDGL